MLAFCLLMSAASAQTASIARRHPQVKTADRDDPRDLNPRKGNPTLEKHSLSAVKIKPPRKFKVHDLITIIIREQTKYESEAELETKKRYDINAQLNAIFKPIAGTLGAGTFSNGNPNVDFKFSNRLKNESEKDREDRFTTRITGEIIDIKPNGNLVIQAKAKTTFDDEVTVITLTGTARKVDVTPDNTVLSTQLADKVIDVKNTGAVRDGSRRGWIPRVIDWFRPV
ncbi:MAG: flagellar basal body L-ring protein FlgH [Mycobacterium sp.]